VTTEKFKTLMKQAGLTKKALSQLLDTSYNTVNGWGTNNRGYPYWVESWLKLYVDNKKCRELKELLQETVGKYNGVLE
jgi:hypothetical protein